MGGVGFQHLCYAFSPQSTVNPDTRLKRLNRGWVWGGNTGLTQSFDSVLPSGNSEGVMHTETVDSRKTHCLQFIQPTFYENQWKWLGDWNIPIPSVGPHPLHAHELISRRWKRTRACIIEREIRDFLLCMRVSIQAPHCGWNSPLKKKKIFFHIHLVGQRGHADVLPLNSGGHSLTYSTDNQPFEK